MQKFFLALPIFLLILILGITAFYLFRPHAVTGPSTHLGSDLSSTQSELADIERRISGMARSGGLPVELSAMTPFLLELPAVADDWVQPGAGDAKDPFGARADSHYFFVRLSSGNWFLLARGPDHDIEIGMRDLQKWESQKRSELLDELLKVAYDPTNGSLSSGDFFRIGAIPFR